MTTYLYVYSVLDECSPLDKEAMSNDTCDNSGIFVTYILVFISLFVGGDNVPGSASGSIVATTELSRSVV